MRTKEEIEQQLFYEIDSICKKNHVQYLLYGEYALQVYLKESIKDIPREIDIAMTLNDAKKFIEAVKKENRSDRFVEGILTNISYNNNEIAYGDTTTIDYEVKKANYNKEHGICIRIKIITKAIWPNKIIDLFQKASTIRIVNNKFWPLKWVLAVCHFMWCYLGIGKWWNNKLQNEYFVKSWKNILINTFVGIDFKKWDTRYFYKMQEVSYDGITALLPYDVDAYFTKIAGIMWREKELKPQNAFANRFISTCVSYKDYDVARELKDIRANYEWVAANRLLIKKHRDIVDGIWDKVLTVNDYVNGVMNLSVEGKIDSLKELNPKDPSDRQILEVELAPIVRAYKKAEKIEYAFSPSDDIEELVKDYLMTSSRRQAQTYSRILRIREAQNQK